MKDCTCEKKVRFGKNCEMVDVGQRLFERGLNGIMDASYGSLEIDLTVFEQIFGDRS